MGEFDLTDKETFLEHVYMLADYLQNCEYGEIARTIVQLKRDNQVLEQRLAELESEH